MKKAIITGITGQDGSYLAELLLSKNYEVHGLVRRTSTPNTSRIDHIAGSLHLHPGDMTDSGSLNEIVKAVQPDEIYNLAAQSHVKLSFEMPEQTAEADAIGFLKLLEAARRIKPDVRIYQAGTSEMFGNSPAPQSESTLFHPRSPYGVSKLFAHWLGINYREAYGMFVTNGILFNHESPRRGENFVTRKVTLAAARISLGLQDKLALGNLDARRDWGFAGDFVEAMWLMLQQEKSDDYVVSTGESHTIEELCDEAFTAVGLDWREHVVVDKSLLRPSEVPDLRGDPSKVMKQIGWKPKTSFKQIIEMMVAADVELVRKAK